jgi:hypothetical protein
MRTRYPVFIHVEEAEDVSLEGVEPSLPSPEVLAARLTDVLADQTKHDATTGWRVIAVERA